VRLLRTLLGGGLLALAVLAGACERRDPVAPPAAPQHDSTGTYTPCDSACEAGKNPMMGGGSG
jgi:hypothetical protein